MSFCSSCGGELPGDAQFCAHCGSVQDVDQDSPASKPVPSDEQEGGGDAGSSGGSKRTGLKILIGAVVAAVFVGVMAFVVSLASGGGSTNMALVFEPGRDGYGDVYVVGAVGDPYDREDRVLSDVVLRGVFREAISATTWAGRSSADFEVEGGRLIAYREEGDDEITIGVVDSSGHGVVPLADENRSSALSFALTISRTLPGGVFGEFSDNFMNRFDDGGRCLVYRLGGDGDVELLGRGTICDVSSSGAVLIVDSRSSKTDLTVRKPDGTTAVFTTQGTVREAGLSPSGVFAALVIADPDTGASMRVEVFDANTSEFFERKFPPNGSIRLAAVLDSAVIFWVDFDGVSSLYSLGVAGDHLLVEGDVVRARVSPGGTHVLVKSAKGKSASFADDTTEFSVLDLSSGDLTGAISIESSRYGPAGWLSDDDAVIVAYDGDVVVLDTTGRESDAGHFGGSVDAWGSVRQCESEIATVEVNHDVFGELTSSSLGVFPARSRTMLNVVDEVFSIGGRFGGDCGFPVSSDGRFLALTVKQDSEDEDQILYVFDTVNDELIEVDGNRSFSHIVFDGDTIIYGVQMSDDVDDVETRRLNLVSQTRPEVIYEGAVAIVPEPATP